MVICIVCQINILFLSQRSACEDLGLTFLFMRLFIVSIFRDLKEISSVRTLKRVAYIKKRIKEIICEVNSDVIDENNKMLSYKSWKRQWLFQKLITSKRFYRCTVI